MSRCSLTIGAVVVAVTTWSCGGGSSNGSNSTTPTAPAAQSSASIGAVTVSIVGSAGSGAFAPNPVQVAAGGALAWKNNDTTAHHIVLDNGSADLGDVVPGATTRSTTVASSNAVNYHCTIHPSMVGSINGTAAPAPPDSNSPYPAGRAHVH